MKNNKEPISGLPGVKISDSESSVTSSESSLKLFDISSEDFLTLTEREDPVVELLDLTAREGRKPSKRERKRARDQRRKYILEAVQRTKEEASKRKREKSLVKGDLEKEKELVTLFEPSTSGQAGYPLNKSENFIGLNMSFVDVIRAASNDLTEEVAGAQISNDLKALLLTVVNFDIASKLKGTKEKLVRSAQSLFEYKGMDIWIILQKYLLKAKNDAEAEDNLIHMIVLLCERGTNFSHYKAKMSSDGTKKLEKIANKYGLITKLTKGVSNELTLARIGHCFPMLCCTYMTMCQSPTVAYSTMEAWAEGYPKCMMTSAFTALIPSAGNSGFTMAHQSTLIHAYLAHQIEFSKVVMDKKDHKKNMGEWYELTYKFAIAGVSAKYLPDKTRLECLVNLGIWSDTDTSFKSSAIEIAAKKLERVANVEDY